MSARSATGKSNSTTKTTATTKAKPKSRLAGAKPPRTRAAASAAKTVSKPATTAKPRTSKIPAPDMAAKPATAAPVTPDELKKRELIDLVVARSDVKKKYAKPVVEALLDVLAETLAKGREMNLQPLGKLKYNRTKETPSARVVVAKIRQSKTGNTGPSTSPSTGQDRLADAAE